MCFKAFDSLKFCSKLIKKVWKFVRKKIKKKKKWCGLASLNTHYSSVTIPVGNRLRDLKTSFIWTRKSMGPKIEPEGHLPVNFNRYVLKSLYTISYFLKEKVAFQQSQFGLLCPIILKPFQRISFFQLPNAGRLVELSNVSRCSKSLHFLIKWIR